MADATSTQTTPSETTAEISCCNEVPFNDQDADLIVRSVPDKIDFRVHKAFLSVTSLVFRDMLSLPQCELEGSSGFAAAMMKDGLHIVPLVEDQKTIAILLKMCYPRWMIRDCEPLFSTVDEVLTVLTAAKKYAMDGVEREVCAVLVSPRFLEPDPLRVFALAVQHGFYGEAKICGGFTLRTPILQREYKPELEYITAGTYHRLQNYHIQCGDAAHAIAQVQDLRWITSETWTWFECSSCRGSTLVIISGDRRKWAAKWWAEFMLEASKALKERPSGATVGIDSDVVQLALEKASACQNTCRARVFREMRQFCAIFAAEVGKATGAVCILAGRDSGLR
ncbi:hypothetical protein R3P38DRAFT_3402298 [Favolaschia claudopus]|uniref:BTB domain-containing protein n=1 Tax=Favolaschia claudopus TaxID=2862362 RepID=A0AAW0AKH0_9AGAR